MSASLKTITRIVSTLENSEDPQPYSITVTTKGSLKIKLGGAVKRQATANREVKNERLLKLLRAEFVEASCCLRQAQATA